MDRVASSNYGSGKRQDILPFNVFPFLKLPRELRDQIYDYTFSLPDSRSPRTLRIERRNLKYFIPTAASILLLLHHEYFLLDRQVAREALEILFKRHTVLFSCGPFVLQSLLSTLEAPNGPSRTWLTWLQSVELDWVTFPNLSLYPPDRTRSEPEPEEWWDDVEDEYVCSGGGGGSSNRGARHFDEHDYTGGHYDDNLYDPGDNSGPLLYPSYPSFRAPLASAPPSNDPFGFATHDPFMHPESRPATNTGDAQTNLSLLIQHEVTPLFSYLMRPLFSLHTLVIPLYFISASTLASRRAGNPSRALPLKIRYWIAVTTHALSLLLTHPKTLQRVQIRYRPWDIWASMDPADNLDRMVEHGVWFDDPVSDGVGTERETEGEAFRVVWEGLEGVVPRERLRATLEVDKWDGVVEETRVGDELVVSFERKEK